MAQRVYATFLPRTGSMRTFVAHKLGVLLASAAVNAANPCARIIQISAVEPSWVKR